MKKKMHFLFLFFSTVITLTLTAPVLAQSDIKDIIKLEEVTRTQKTIPLRDVDVVDRRSGKIVIRIDRDAIKKLPNGSYRLRMFASYRHNNGEPVPVKVENYYSKTPLSPRASTTRTNPGQSDSSSLIVSYAGTNSLSAEDTEVDPSAQDSDTEADVDLTQDPPAQGSGSTTQDVQDDASIFRYHDHRFEIKDGQVISPSFPPNGEIVLSEQKFEAGDVLILRVREVGSASQHTYDIRFGEFGMNVKIVDSLLLLKRLGVSKEEEEGGENNINFRPAPGVTFGWVYSSRHNKFWRFLSPGIGYNLSFTDWGDPAFDVASGQFVQGTDANKIEITTGPIVSFFDNTLHFTYGYNLNVRTDRKYFGVGFSFVKLSEKLAGLIKQED